MDLIAKRPNGTQDMLPSQANKWHTVEKIAKDTAGKYGFKEIRFPMFEDFYEYGNSVFCIWENGVTTTEVWEAAPTGYLYMQCLSSFDVMTNNLGFEYEKGKIAVSGRVEVYASDWNTKRRQAQRK